VKCVIISCDSTKLNLSNWLRESISSRTQLYQNTQHEIWSMIRKSINIPNHHQHCLVWHVSKVAVENTSSTFALLKTTNPVKHWEDFRILMRLQMLLIGNERKWILSSCFILNFLTWKKWVVRRIQDKVDSSN
jgi:hypothetical protein